MATIQVRALVGSTYDVEMDLLIPAHPFRLTIFIHSSSVSNFGRLQSCPGPQMPLSKAESNSHSWSRQLVGQPAPLADLTADETQLTAEAIRLSLDCRHQRLWDCQLWLLCTCYSCALFHLCSDACDQCKTMSAERPQ